MNTKNFIDSDSDRDPDPDPDWLIAIIQGMNLDSAYIIRHLTQLCELKETPEIVAQVRRLLENKP